MPTKSPLEQPVTRIARLIAVVAVAAGLAFLPLGLLAGLSFTTVICTDKTGTLTWNRMSAVAVGVAGRQLDVSPDLPPDPDVDALAAALVSCAITTGTGVAVEAQVSHLAARGLRVLAVARRSLPDRTWPKAREQAEHDLCLLGLVALLDPPRPEVREAVRICHEAGLRVIVITGDNPETARKIAREVGIGDAGARTVTGAQVDNLSDAALTVLLQPGQEVICSRSSPEDKIRIAAALQAHDEVVAMTGDGVNDAPALRRADIGVAMGRSGTDVAREAATVVLTDDNFSTIVVAIEEGRRIFDNVRKFIVYIFAHAVPEVVPFLVFALSGGRIPLPLTVLQILAIDLGTETLPALALAREPAEPGIMAEPPRARHGQLVTGQMLLRAWALLG